MTPVDKPRGQRLFISAAGRNLTCARGLSAAAFFQPPVGKPGITVVLNARSDLIVGYPGGSDVDRRNERVE